MKKFAIYIRVSTQKQGRSGLGLESQRDICNNFITSNNGKVVAEFKDVESGTHRERKGLANAVSYCKQNDCALVIAKLDRLARDVEFCFRIVNTGIEIHFCDMPSVNTLLLGVFASVAQYERELTSDRTKKALAVKKVQGCKLGAANEKYRSNYDKKTKEQIEELSMRRGSSKTERYLASRDVQAFAKILKNVFPDACTHEDMFYWDWGKINTKKDNKNKIARLMSDYKDMDESGKLFRSWTFSDKVDKPLQNKIGIFLLSLRRSVNRSHEHNNN